MAELELIALANARKLGGRIVLGWRVDAAASIAAAARPGAARPGADRSDASGFVRLVAARGAGALSLYDIQLDNARGEADEPRVFDLIRVGVVGPQPMPHQPENWLVDESPWKLVRRPAPRRILERLLPLLDRGPGLLGGVGASVPFGQCARHPLSASLAIARPQHATLAIVDRLGKRRVRLQFQLNGAQFDLTVTDPRWEQAVALWQPGDYPWWQVMPSGRPPLITVSLTEPFGDTACCYKVVANLWPGPEMLGAAPPKPQPPAERRRWRGLRTKAAKPPASAIAPLPLLDTNSSETAPAVPR
jgi:hypothetical protein